MEHKIEVERVRELFDYDEDNGWIIRKFISELNLDI